MEKYDELEPALGEEIVVKKRLYEQSPMNWESFEKLNFPEQSWRIRKLVPKEGFMILASISGEGKSWIGLEMAKSIVSGNDFLGNPEFIVEPGNVLYIDMEMSPGELQRRCKQIGMKEGENKIYFANQSDFDLTNITDINQMIWLQRYVLTLNIKTIFMDTLRAVAGGLKEDKAEDVRFFFNEFREYKSSGVSVVWLDHCRKPNNFEGKVPKKEHLLGSQDKTASIEVLNMIKSGEGDEIGFYQRKNRLAPEISPFTIKMGDVLEDGEVKTKLCFSGVIESKEVKKDQAKVVIKDLLAGESLTTSQILLILQDQHKIGSRNVREALGDLVTLKEVDFAKEGRQNIYFLPANTEIGAKRDREQESDDF